MSGDVLSKFFSDKNYDVRLSKNGRWIDQKCTHDVMSFVADCICYYLENGGSQPFESPSVWRSDYAIEHVQGVFGKPYPLAEESHDEFNKFFRQPMKALAAAGVLKEVGKVRNKIQFELVEKEVLEYIAHPWNAQKFMQEYIEKTLVDSGLWPKFDSFFKSETKDSLRELKYSFADFCYRNTPIRTEREVGRIFSKVLNPLAFKYKKRGIVGGRLSDCSITLSDMTYNRTNFRDDAVRKDKHIARRQYEFMVGNPEATGRYAAQKQMRALKQFNAEYRNSVSEVVDELALGVPANQAHHIFPKGECPEIANCLENLIMLTSAQHYQRAHPNGDTGRVDLGYQFFCLMHKLKSIKTNLENEVGIPKIYDMENFRKVLSEGLQTDYFELIDFSDYEAISDGIRIHYPASVVSTYTFVFC